jgi:hypothetical protein
MLSRFHSGCKMRFANLQTRAAGSEWNKHTFSARKHNSASARHHEKMAPVLHVGKHRPPPRPPTPHRHRHIITTTTFSLSTVVLVSSEQCTAGLSHYTARWEVSHLSTMRF